MFIEELASPIKEFAIVARVDSGESAVAEGGGVAVAADGRGVVVEAEVTGVVIGSLR